MNSRISTQKLAANTIKTIKMKMEIIVSILKSVLCISLDLIDGIMSWATRKFLRCAMIVLSWAFIPYSRLVSLRIQRKKLPPLKSNLLEIPAIQLAHMIRTKQLTSEAVVEAYIERCKDVNPYLNAIVEERFDDAIKDARNVDALIAKGDKSPEEMEHETPLLGIPLTVKESIGVKGMSNQAGRKHKNKYVARDDAPCVKQVKQCGAIILCVTNTPELCMNWETYNKVTGTTKNPHDLRRTPGGSSGGEAALLGAGASLIGLSSDIAGSSRLPAMFTGVWGHKPTPFVVSPDGHVPGSSVSYWGEYFTIAPMTRYAVDLPLLLKCMKDPNGPIVQLDKEISMSDIKFYYMENDGPSGMLRPLSSDMRKGILNVAQYFNASKVKIEQLKWALDISMCAMLKIEEIESIYYQTDNGEQKKNSRTELLKYLCCKSDSTFNSVIFSTLQGIVNLIPESRQQKCDSIRKSLKQHFKDLLGTNGVFLYPTFPTSAHRHFQIYHKIVDASYMMVFNTIGLPVTNCMIGLDRHQMPIGIQVVANPGQDHLALAVAKEIEKRYGGWVQPPHNEAEKVNLL